VLQTNQGQPISLVGTFESPVMLSAYLLDADSTSKILDGAPYDASSPVVTINQACYMQACTRLRSPWGMQVLCALGSVVLVCVLDMPKRVGRVEPYDRRWSQAQSLLTLFPDRLFPLCCQVLITTSGVLSMRAAQLGHAGPNCDA
jgi:hypothetical protein